jgi:hypothetical protein
VIPGRPSGRAGVSAMQGEAKAMVLTSVLAHLQVQRASGPNPLLKTASKPAKGNMST